MNLIDWFKNRWKSEAEHSTYKFIESPHVQGRTMFATPALSGEHYFQITLAEMFLKNDRKWFTEYSPAVYSVVTLKFGDKIETLSHVAGPSGLKDLKADSVNAGVTINYPLIPLTPFNGGTVQIEAGLVALPGKNDVKRLLKVLTDVSKSLAVPQLSVALTFAQPLVDGITELVGADTTRLVLRLHDAFNQGKPIASRYLVSINAPDATLDEEQMWVKGDRLYYGPNQAGAQGLKGYDYALFRVDVVDERDDYGALSAIDGPYQSAIDALGQALQEPDLAKRKEKLDEATRLLGAAKVAVYKSKELTFKTGRRQAIQALQKGFDEAKALLAASGAADQPYPRTLAQAMKGAISVQEALALGEISSRDLTVVSGPFEA